MAEQEFVRVSEAITSAILEREQVHPVFLERNEDNTFTATFQDATAPEMRHRILSCDDTIRLVEPEVVEARQPNTEPNMAATVRFGFIETPETDFS